MNKELYSAKLQVAILDACNKTNFGVFIEFFGSGLIKKNKWNVSSERDAVSLYLVKKYGWTLDYCEKLETGDMQLILTEEISGWKVPTDLESVFEPVWIAAKTIAK